MVIFFKDYPPYEPDDGFKCQSDEDCNKSPCISSTQTCKCFNKYYGQKCNMTSQDCQYSVCNGNGQCIWPNPICNCDENYILQYCNFTIDDCSQNLCNGNGNCSYNQETQIATCNCNQQFRGTYCTDCADNYSKIGEVCYPSSCIQPGTLSVCSNGGGKCDYISESDDGTVGYYQCSCYSAYTSTYCEQCAKGYQEFEQKCTTENCITESSVCYDRGQCVDDKCSCEDDYYGAKCEFTCSCGNGQCKQGQCVCDQGYVPIKISEDNVTCYNNNCVNNNIVCSGNIILCQDNACNCQYEDYNLNGQYCERKCSDYCDFGTCYTDKDTQEIKCICPEYMYGDRCSEYNCPQGQIPLQGKCTFIQCVTDDLKICNNHGQCLTESKQCQCDQNWYQDKCTQSQYECNQNRCQGKGVCNANGTCSCNNGIVASDCTSCNSTEILINNQCVDKNCMSDITNKIICNNQGVCQTGVCICNQSWTNVQCQETDIECRQKHCNDVGVCNVKDNQQICECELLNYGYQCEKCEVSEEVIFIDNKYCTPINCAYENTVCSYQGTCINNVCDCNDQYFGQYCEITAENCSQLLCSGNGECYNDNQDQEIVTQQVDLKSRYQKQTYFVSTTQKLVCNCTQHYSLPDCKICPEGHTLFLGQCIQNGWFDPNDTVICNEHGYIGYDAICVCDDGFVGKTCKLTIQNCDQQLCNSKGICDEKGYQCTCNKQNYAGEYCQKCNSGYIGNGCINSTPVIVSVVVVLVVIIICIVVIAYIIWQKRTKMGSMKQIKQIGFGFNKGNHGRPEPQQIELKV